MSHRQTIYFSDDGIARVKKHAKSIKRSVSFIINEMCEDLPDPKPAKKAKNNGNKR